MPFTGTQHEWTAPDGEIFPYRVWEPDPMGKDSTRAVLVAVHGLGGAAQDFEPLAAHLLAHRLLPVMALELRGQGNDPKRQRRGDLLELEHWFRDLSAFLSLARECYPNAQIYLYGESMGAALLTRFLAQAREDDLPAGLVLASPVVVVPGKPSWWQQFIFHFFLRVNPGHRLDLRRYTKRDRDNPAKWVTRDEAHRRWYETAPHKLDSFTIRFFKNLFDLIGGCMAAAPKINVPVLVIYAANDVFIPPARVEEFFAKLGSHEKELRFFPESYHLLLHDFDKAEVLACLEGWLRRRMRIEVTGGAVPE